MLSTLISNVYGDLDLRIPAVDMNDFYAPERREEFLNTLYDAMSTVGFFAVRNTGIDREGYREAKRQSSQPSICMEIAISRSIFWAGKRSMDFLSFAHSTILRWTKKCSRIWKNLSFER